MNNKNEIENLNIEFNDNIEIEYNEDFSSEKTKSLNKFPVKIIQNNEFNLDNSQKIFSKTLNFNCHQCFAPKAKKKRSNKNPSPIIFKKHLNNNKMNDQIQIIKEDILSEKESSLNNESSFSYDSKDDNENNNDNDNNENNINNNNDNNDININNIELKDNSNYKLLNQNNIIIENKNTDSNIFNKENINIIKDISKDNKKNVKNYEHKTINVFYGKNNDKNSKKSIKRLRNNLFYIKKNYIKKANKEVEYAIKEKDKKKYRLDLIKDLKKSDLDNEYKIIPINTIEDNTSDEENEEDMSKFRKTIKFSNSKINKENNNINENKGVTIFDVLINNKKK